MLKQFGMTGSRAAFWQFGMQRWGRLRQLRETSGSQLVEFALALPFLAVLLVGIADFGQAYNTKHILVNAAREAARITASNHLSDSYTGGGSCTNWSITSPGSGTPCSIQAAADGVSTYLTNNGLTASSCSGATYSTPMTWTFSCGSANLVIDKAYVVSGGASGVVSSTQVTLSYPYTWSFGYVISLLGGTGPTGTKTLSTTVVMQNLALN